jgi:hypothetical protein
MTLTKVDMKCAKYRWEFLRRIPEYRINKGHYRFEADCILDDKLFGEFYKSDEGWVSDGIYSGKSNIGLSIQEYPWIKIAGVCTEENSVGRDYSFGLNHSFICLTK